LNIDDIRISDQYRFEGSLKHDCRSGAELKSDGLIRSPCNGNRGQEEGQRKGECAKLCGHRKSSSPILSEGRNLYGRSDPVDFLGRISSFRVSWITSNALIEREALHNPQKHFILGTTVDYVCIWHKTDMAATFGDVRYREKSRLALTGSDRLILPDGQITSCFPKWLSSPFRKNILLRI